MKILNSKLKIKLHPRFFVIFGAAFLLSGVLWWVNFGTKPKASVLAADTYTLKDPSADSNLNSTANYTPITISYEVKKGDTIYSIAEKYHADPQTILDYPYNNIPDDLTLKVGENLIIPNGYINPEDAPALPPIARGTGQFIWPVHGTVTQYASWFHQGSIDIGISLGIPVVAADDGTVIYAGWDSSGYGNTVLISHGDGLTSRYGHLSKINVIVGQGIRKGESVGLSGSTGRSTGPHLHFEVRKNGAPIDPMTLL